LEKTSLLAAYVSSKTNGEDRPIRIRNYVMDRQVCPDFARCPGEPKRI
jgi:hypothetical protein